uniref:solute carrier family 25 member 32 isoform X2 n=1 Tax=Myxine glutinosa TaxID=7769 RepID=UPI00358FB275
MFVGDCGVCVSDGLSSRPMYRGFVHCLGSIWRQQGLRGLYQGVTPNVCGSGASWGLYFFFYQAIKAYKQEGRSEPLGPTQHMISAAGAGAATLCFTNPIWVTKTRLVLQYENVESQRQYRGMFDALTKIFKHEGIRGLYKGFVPGLFGTSHGALQFMAYEELKNRYNEHLLRPTSTHLSTSEYLSMAALSKTFAVASTYPYQVVRARLQDQHTSYAGICDVMKCTWRNEGLGGFYKGMVPNIVRVTPACCITFVVYEQMSHLLRNT